MDCSVIHRVDIFIFNEHLYGETNFQIITFMQQYCIERWNFISIDYVVTFHFASVH